MNNRGDYAESSGCTTIWSPVLCNGASLAGNELSRLVSAYAMSRIGGEPCAADLVDRVQDRYGAAVL